VGIFGGEFHGGLEAIEERGCLDVVGPAEASKEEKWPQLADPEVLSWTEPIDRQNHRQHIALSKQVDGGGIQQ